MRKLTGNGSFRFVKKENARVSLHLDVRMPVAAARRPKVLIMVRERIRR